MLLPAEKQLRAGLAQYAQARIEHDVLPSGRTSRALEDATHTLCAMTGAADAAQALLAADALLERYRADRRSNPRTGGTLAA
ncbi:DUF5133 domain-containing protein [Streptomyces sp. NPDC001920]